MRTSRNVQIYSILFLFLSAFTTAWPWPRWLPDLDALIVRQDSDNSTVSNTQKSSFTPTPTATVVSKGTTVTLYATEPPSSVKDGSENKTTATNTHHTSYDARLPAGGISMLTPAAISGPQYFKIGDYVTLAWNYTSLSATPTAVNVMATGSSNKQLYTIAMNQTVTNATQGVIWDTHGYQATAVQDPLLTQTYTLIIYDSDSSISANAEAGYLAVFNSYTFGMYTPQAYTPLGEFICATCNAALGDMEKRALGMMFGMCILTVLSFTWFVNGLNVIW
jgi:hypothetical protein